MSDERSVITSLKRIASEGLDAGNEDLAEGLDGNGEEEVDQEVEVEGGVEANAREAANTLEARMKS